MFSDTSKRFISTFLLAATGLVIAHPSDAAPFISEIMLPATGGTAIEIDGLDSAGATLLIVNASRDRLTVQHAIPLPPADQTLGGLGLALVVGPNWAAAAPGGPLQATTIHREYGLFTDQLPVALVLIHGPSVIGEDVSLGSGGAISGIAPSTPIVDWIGFARGTDAQAQIAVQNPNAEAIAALGIADLSRPTAGTSGLTALARALTIDGPVMGSLLGGSDAGIDADPLGLRDFAFSPGLRNPLTRLAADEDDASVPEPGVAALLGLGGLWASARPRRRP